MAKAGIETPAAQVNACRSVGKRASDTIANGTSPVQPLAYRNPRKKVLATNASERRDAVSGVPPNISRLTATIIGTKYKIAFEWVQHSGKQPRFAIMAQNRKKPPIPMRTR